MSDLLDRFELTDGERMHPLWVRLDAHLKTQLQRLRERNDRSQSEQETARIRGHIECLKVMMRLGEVRPLTGDE